MSSIIMIIMMIITSVSECFAASASTWCDCPCEFFDLIQVMYVGPVAEFKTKEQGVVWIGVKYDLPVGKNDGRAEVSSCLAS
jgi:hypothetical protein